MGCRFFGFDDRGIELPSGSREIPIRLRADGNGSSLPREVFNMSETEPVVAVVARSDAREWENIVEYDRDREG